MPRWFRPAKLFSYVVVVIAAGLTAIGLFLVGVTWAAPGKAWYWNLVIPVMIAAYLWLAWTLALSGAWVEKRRVFLVAPLVVRVLDPNGVQEVGLEDRLGGLLAVAYMRYAGRKLLILRISAYQLLGPGRARRVVERLVQDLEQSIREMQRDLA